MDEYLIFMRLDLITKEAQPSPEQMQVYMKMYQDWVGEITAEEKFCESKGLSFEGKVLRANQLITDGPYAEIKESIAGFIVVRAIDMDDAVRMAAKCPILQGEGNSVEVRKAMTRDDRS